MEWIFWELNTKIHSGQVQNVASITTLEPVPRPSAPKLATLIAFEMYFLKKIRTFCSYITYINQDVLWDETSHFVGQSPQVLEKNRRKKTYTGDVKYGSVVRLFWKRAFEILGTNPH